MDRYSIAKAHNRHSYKIPIQLNLRLMYINISDCLKCKFKYSYSVAIRKNKTVAYLFSELEGTPDWNVECVAVKRDVILLSQQT